MANTKSAKKSIEKSRTQHKTNSSNRSKLKTFIKKANIAIQKKDKHASLTSFILVQKIIDQQITKRLIHKNKAARYKSNIFKKIKLIPNID